MLEFGSHSGKFLEFLPHSPKTNNSLRKSLKFAKTLAKWPLHMESLNFTKFLFSSLFQFCYYPQPVILHILCNVLSTCLFHFWVDMTGDAIKVPNSCLMQTPKSKRKGKVEKGGVKLEHIRP